MRRIPVTESPAEGDQSQPTQTAAESKSSNPAAQATSPDQDDGENLQADLDRFRDLALRSQADFENYKKRAAREKDDAIKYANSSLLERLVPILDNFELGLSAAREGGKTSPIFSGMSMILKQLNDFLTESGVQPIEAEGKQFDPNLHEA